MELCFVIYMFLSNNPSSGDINSSNLPCCILFWVLLDYLKGKAVIMYECNRR